MPQGNLYSRDHPADPRGPRPAKSNAARLPPPFSRNNGEDRVRVLIAGAGAVGGYIGACLARAGEDVTLFARGPHLRAMQQQGLRIVSADGDFAVHPRVIGALSDAGAADVIVLGVKAHS